MTDALLHPLRTADEALDLVQVLDRYVRLLELQEQRQSEIESLLRGQIVNRILFSGGVQLNGSDWTTLDAFTVPYAAVTVSDPNGIGDVLVANDSINDPAVQRAREGRWLLKASDCRTFGMSGAVLSLSSLPGTSGIVYVTVWLRHPGGN